MEVQSRVHFERQEARVGAEDQVLIDGREGELAIGRTAADAPEVDGVVRITDPEEQLQRLGQNRSGAGSWSSTGAIT